jgi:hypothetical protein
VPGRAPAAGGHGRRVLHGWRCCAPARDLRAGARVPGPRVRGSVRPCLLPQLHLPACACCCWDLLPGLLPIEEPCAAAADLAPPGAPAPHTRPPRAQTSATPRACSAPAGAARTSTAASGARWTSSTPPWARRWAAPRVGAVTVIAPAEACSRAGALSRQGAAGGRAGRRAAAPPRPALSADLRPFGGTGGSALPTPHSPAHAPTPARTPTPTRRRLHHGAAGGRGAAAPARAPIPLQQHPGAGCGWRQHSRF